MAYLHIVSNEEVYNVEEIGGFDKLGIEKNYNLAVFIPLGSVEPQLSIK